MQAAITAPCLIRLAQITEGWIYECLVNIGNKSKEILYNSGAVSFWWIELDHTWIPVLTLVVVVQYLIALETSENMLL